MNLASLPIKSWYTGSRVRLMMQLRSDPLPVCAPKVSDTAELDTLPRFGLYVGFKSSNLFMMTSRTSDGEKCCVRGTVVNTTLGGSGTSTDLIEYTCGCGSRTSLSSMSLSSSHVCPFTSSALQAKCSMASQNKSLDK